MGKKDDEPSPSGHTLRGLLVFGCCGVVLAWFVIDWLLYGGSDRRFAVFKGVAVMVVVVLLIAWLRERYYSDK